MIATIRTRVIRLWIATTGRYDLVDVNESGAPEVLKRREALIIVNPAAHNAPSRKRLLEANAYLKERGWSLEWVWTQKEGDAIEIAGRAAEHKLPLVLVCAGDGTLNEAVNGLAGSQTAVSVIPAGTSDLWAREAGIPRRPLEAVKLIERSRPMAVDLGRAGDRYFLLMAGFGVDAAVTQNASPMLKSRLGATSYVVSALRELFRFKGRSGRVRLDGEAVDVSALLVLAGNTQRYAGVTKITPQARIDDGLLDICVYTGRGAGDMLGHALRTLARRHLKSDKTLFRRVSHLELDFDVPLPVQVDGDNLLPPPTDVTAVPRSLYAMVPAKAIPRLLPGS
jgi:diacylglycerol kinase (ATP)